MKLHAVPDMDSWLEKSSQLLSNVRLLHPGGLELFGHGLEPELFARWVYARSEEVDQLLVRMALAAGEECMQMLARLDREAVTVLCSRWVHYHDLWEQMRDRGEHHWMPQQPAQLWRAVLLAMVGAPQLQADAAQQLWPEVFAAPGEEG